MRSSGMMGIVATMGLAYAGLGDDVITPARPRAAPQPKPADREKTRHDLARIEAAERKRARKAAKLGMALTSRIGSANAIIGGVR